MDPRIVPFYRQYLQQLNEPAYPPANVLIEPAIQEQVSSTMFDGTHGAHLPPLSYQRRILKTLTEAIESAIKDPDEDVCISFPDRSLRLSSDILPRCFRSFLVHHPDTHLSRRSQTA